MVSVGVVYGVDTETSEGRIATALGGEDLHLAEYCGAITAL